MTDDELDEVAAFIAARQADPAQLVAYLGTDPVGVRAELDAVSPPWASTVRVVRDDAGALVGAVLVEWDEETGRSWVFGPWVDGGDDLWGAHAGPLLDAALAQVPPTVTRHELSGAVANQRLAWLAAERGWWATEVNHAIVCDAATVAGWPEPDEEGLRAGTPADAAGIRSLHDAEFPTAYIRADQLFGEHKVVLVADGRRPDGAIAGFIVGYRSWDGDDRASGS